MRATHAFAGLTVAFATLAATAFAACSARHDPAPGAILVAIDTNLKVPDDLDGIGLAISDSKGVVSEDLMFPLGTGIGATFPATFAVLRGTSLPVTVRVVGYKGDTVVTVREATTTLPDDRTALLHLDLNYLNEGMVTGNANELVSKLTTTCAAGTTPIGGTCQPITLDSLSLPDYQATALGSSTDAASSIDIDGCFVGGASITPTRTGTACTVPVPGSPVNFGLTLPAGSAGWCNGASCVVPILSASGSTSGGGWELDPDGTIHLPQGVCDKGLPVFTAPVTSSCPVFSLQYPAHQDYGAIVDSGTGIADAADGSAVTQPRFAVQSISVDDTAVYILSAPSETSTTIETLPLGFTPGQRGPTVTLPYTVVSGTSAAQYPYVALPVGSGAGSIMLAVDVTDASAPRTFGTDVDPGNFALTTGGDGGTFLVYIDGYTGAFPAAYAGNVALLSDASAPVAGGSAVSAIAATSGDGGSLVAFAAGTGSAETIYSGTYPALAPLVTLLHAEPLHLSFVDQRLVWQDSLDALYASGPAAQPNPPELLAADSDVAPSTHGAVLTGGAGRLFWVSPGGIIYEAALGDGGFATTPAPANVGSPDANVISLVVRNGTLYWADTSGGVYRQPLSAIP
jgi:hypothetical protein